MRSTENRARELLGGLSRELLMKHTREISRHVRLSGSAQEAKALGYVRRQLEKSGFEVREHAFNSYVGLPESASLTIIASNTRYAGTTPALSVPTPPGGLEGELVDVGSGESYEGVDAKGRIALVDGLLSPRLAKLAEENGAAGEVFINDSRAHEGIASVVWGTPTPETAKELPKTPSMSVARREGEQLRELLKKGRVGVVLRTKVKNRWRKVPVLTGELGAEGDFVLLSGHIDSWHRGAMDNASGNALMLEVGRILSEHREILRRGIRIAFWSGHSHGRYSGSTWYADRFWGELYERCVAHVNVDSVGAVGATDLTRQQVMKEAEKFVASAVQEATGQEAQGVRFSRAGDQSFWGLGVTSMLCEVSERPPRGRRGDLTPWGWWWHTPGDTLDKIEPDFLLRDAKVYLLVVGGLCSGEVLPFRFEASVREIEGVLGGLLPSAKGRVDLAGVVAEARRLRGLLRELERRRKRAAGGRAEARLMNDALKQLGRLLIPVNYTKAGQFDQDMAVPIPPLPGLHPLLRLGAMPDSEESRHLATRLQREANRLLHALLEARRVVERTIRELDRGARVTASE